MKHATLVALKRSIEKWEKIASGTGASKDEGCDNCALCKRFKFPLCRLDFEPDGEECPVAIAAGDTGCRATPYDRWSDLDGPGVEASALLEDQLEAAKAELAFLKSLLP